MDTTLDDVSSAGRIIETKIRFVIGKQVFMLFQKRGNHGLQLDLAGQILAVDAGPVDFATEHAYVDSARWETSYQ